MATMVATESIVSPSDSTRLVVLRTETESSTQSSHSGISRRRSDALGNSKLCSKCALLFTNSLSLSNDSAPRAGPSRTESTAHSRGLIPFHSLKRTAVQAGKGCHLCLQVYLGLDPDAHKIFSRFLKSDAIAKAAFDGSCASGSGQPSNDSSKGFVSIVPNGKHKAKLSFIFTQSDVAALEIVKPHRNLDLRVDFLLVHAQHKINRNICLISAKSTSTASEESFDTARQWINECSINHTKCFSPPDEDWKPTYLLDVGLTDFRNTPGVRLVEGVFVESESEYVTLSHCWGSSKTIRLHKGTLSALRQGVACVELPATHADAVLVAQRLGYQYIWIDALCIMHDDEQAVLNEMAQMHRIYKSAALNIAATCASADSEGLFRPRNPDALLPCKVSIKGHEVDDGRYNVLRSSTWHDSIDNSPLAKRAWVLQERALARRTLHFTRHELMWECAQHCCSETYSGDLNRQPETLAPPSLKNHGERSSKSASINFNKELYLEQADAWSKLVELYSAKRLTYSSDRLMAISGLAKQYMERNGLAKADYVAGLWRPEMPYSLLWKVRNGRRSSKYRAPTWSWASAEGRIQCLVMRDSSIEPCVKITDVEIKHKCGDTFGFCESAQLTVSGFLTQGLLPQNQHDKDTSTCSLQFPAAMIDFHVASFDEERSSQSSQSSASSTGKTIDALEVYVLPILCTSDKIQGLFLKATPNAGHFQRIGTFERTLADDINRRRLKKAIEDGVEASALENGPDCTDLQWFAISNRQTIILV